MVKCEALLSSVISHILALLYYLCSWGDWTRYQECPSNEWLKMFQLQVEPRLFADGDDTAANDINFRCNTTVLLGDSHTTLGDWGDWSGSCAIGIRALRTKIEPHQGSGDDTALNDVEFDCS